MVMVMVMAMAMFPPPSSRHVVTIQHFVRGLGKKSYPRVYKKFKVTGDRIILPKIGRYNYVVICSKLVR